MEDSRFIDFLCHLAQADQNTAHFKFDKETALDAHNAARSRLESLGQRGKVLSFGLCSPVQASAEPSPLLESLQPIQLTELEEGSSHPGRVLYGTLCAHAFKMSGVMTCLEDEGGHAVRLSIYNAKPMNLKKALPKGLKVAIKEPFLKLAADGMCVLRVDNPNSLEKLSADFKFPAPVNVVELRRKGNRHFENQDWKGAIDCYNECIVAGERASSLVNGQMGDALMLAYSNRAEAWIKLHNYEQALADCEKALEICPDHVKSLYRKGRALHELKQYERACACLSSALRNWHDHKEIQVALNESKKCYAQMQERESTILSKCLRGTCKMEDVPKFTEYIGPLTIKKSQFSNRRGLFVCEDVKAGELLLISNAVAVVYQKSMNHSHSLDLRTRKASMEIQKELASKVVELTKTSPQLLRQLYNLPGSSVQKKHENPPVNMFLQGIPEAPEGSQYETWRDCVSSIKNIVRQNAFKEQVSPILMKDGVSSELLLIEEGFLGVWLLPSYINHSCLPSASRMEVGEAMFVHAARDITAGTEITLPYFDALLPLKQREKALRGWGFRCNCKRCALERKLQIPLRQISREFEALHDKAAEEMLSKLTSQNQYIPLPDDAVDLSCVALQLETLISLLDLEEEEVEWLRASYSSAYLAGMQEGFLRDWEVRLMVELMQGVCLPMGRELMMAMQGAVPGHRRILGLVGVHLQVKREITEVGGRRHMQERSSIEDDAKDACVRTFGKQEVHVLNQLIQQYTTAKLFP